MVSAHQFCSFFNLLVIKTDHHFIYLRVANIVSSRVLYHLRAIDFSVSRIRVASVKVASECDVTSERYRMVHQTCST